MPKGGGSVDALGKGALAEGDEIDEGGFRVAAGGEDGECGAEDAGDEEERGVSPVSAGAAYLLHCGDDAGGCCAGEQEGEPVKAVGWG